MSTSKLNSKPGSYTSAISIPSRADGWSPNPRDISQTPGGTMYATTPGGTKIMYERNQLLFLRQSPLSKTPPVHLPFIPGVTGKDDGSRPIPEEDEADSSEDSVENRGGEDEVFKMDE
jgi:hypothetical protein